MLTEKQENKLDCCIKNITSNTGLNKQNTQISIHLWNILENEHLHTSNNEKWMADYKKNKIATTECKLMEPWFGEIKNNNNLIANKINELHKTRMNHYLISKITQQGYKTIMLSSVKKINKNWIIEADSLINECTKRIKNMTANWDMDTIEHLDIINKLHKAQSSMLIKNLGYLKINNNFNFANLILTRSEISYLNGLINNYNHKQFSEIGFCPIKIHNYKSKMLEKTEANKISKTLESLREKGILEYILRHQ